MDTTGVAYPMGQRPAGSRAPKVKHLETKTGLGEKSPGTATVPSGDAAPKAIGAETVPTAASIPGAESDPSTSMAYRYRRDGSGRTATGDDVSTPRPRNRCPPASTDLAPVRWTFSDEPPIQSDKSHEMSSGPREIIRGPMSSTALPLSGSDGPEAVGAHLRGRGCGSDLQGTRPREQGAKAEGGCSQEEGGALQDLMELAGEGLTLTQWDPAAQQAKGPGPEGMPGDVPRSQRLNLSLEEEEEKPPPLRSLSPPSLLGSLAAAFRGMVNNPHLSDVQFQVDSGELFYAHLFVFYARCPRLMEVVDRTGFWVAEEGEAKARRVLLTDVSGEAARVFLSYLYTAEHLVPQHVLSDVAALAIRFGVAELAALCADPSWSGPPAVAACGQEEEERVEQFEELLKSIWVGEEEEDGALLPEEPGGRENVVDEQELEEIYEFAATQREAEEEEGRQSRERPWGAEVGEGAVPGGSLEGEAGPSSPLEPQEQRPLGAASGRSRPEGLPEPGEKSLLVVSWGAESWELFPGSPSGRELGKDEDTEAGGGVALIQSPIPPEPEEELVLLPQGFSRGASRMPLGDPAERLPASPRERGGFSSSDLSLPLFSPAPPEASGQPCPVEEQELPKVPRGAPAGVAASRGTGHIGHALGAPPPPSPTPPPVDLEGSCLPTPGPPAGGGELGQGRWLAEQMGLPLEERGAFGTMRGHLSQEVGVGCCQGRGAPLPGMLLNSEAGGGGVPGPGTPLLRPGGPNDGQVGKLGSASEPGAQWPGDAEDGGPPLKSALIPSPKRRRSLQGWLPHGHRSPPLRSSACLPAVGKSAADVVVILDDSEEEAEAAPWRSGASSVLEVDLPVFEEDSGHLFHEASPERPMAAQAGRCQLGSPPRPLLQRSSTPSGGSCTAGKEPLPCSGCPEEGSCGSDGSLWGQGAETEVLPLPQTPELVCQEREALCTTPSTPMPSYSIMETPVLKKELSRFGVRTLPKQQMVLKLKEIFRYTHQRSDSRDAATSSQPGLCRGARAARRRPTSAVARRGFPQQQQQLPSCPEFPQVVMAGERFEGSSGAGDQGQAAKRGCLPAGPGRRKRAAEGPTQSSQALVASQEADGLLGAASDMSVILLSSSTEFETSVLAEEEEEEEDIPASQSTSCKTDVLVALRQHLRSRPALWRQILLYQPFELARLQSELKQNGIRIALGRLLEFLDAHCITFTTAEARREKRQQSERQGRRRRGRRY
ncbi:UNVERIFIED_CONTAM: hypothetical protein K2H54_016933 [Gekko kuhli]